MLVQYKLVGYIISLSNATPQEMELASEFVPHTDGQWINLVV